MFDPSFAPAVQIATLDGPFEPADYAPADGRIQVPRSYLGTTWRLAYTLPGDITHEVQWAPEDQRGHLTVPMVGRLVREPVPAGSGYTITPTNYSGSYTNPRVLTIGTWTDGPVTSPFTGPTLSTVDYDFASAKTLSGTKASPDPKKGDRGLLVDFALEAFPRVLHVQLVASRSVPALGVSLSAGMETVIAPSAGGGFEIAFPAPVAQTMTLITPNNGTIDLAGASEQVAAGSPTGTFTLDFGLETGAGLRPDYHDVVLHQIAGGKLTARRIFTVTAPKVRIDGSLFAPGDYVFEIRTYKGHPMASLGDFAPVDYPYGAAITFTRTFAISP